MYGKVDVVVEGDDGLMAGRDYCVGGGLWELSGMLWRMFSRGDFGWVSGL